MTVDEWTLMSQIQPGGGQDDFNVTEVVDRKSGGTGKLQTGMSW